MYIYRIFYSGDKTVDIKASHFKHDSDRYLFWTIPKDEANYGNYSAHVVDSGIEAVIRLDMLVETISGRSYLPEIIDRGDPNIDLIQDALFTEDEKIPFSLQERQSISKAIREVKLGVIENFNPDIRVIPDIESKLEYLSKKVNDLTKFDWKRLLVTTLIGVSIDLGFGTLVPASLLELFKKVLGHFAKKFLEVKSSKDRT